MGLRPMPYSATLAVCALLVGTACVMAWQSVALAADGAFQLVLVLGTGDVYGLDTRILGAWAHQGAVVVATRAGVTDTHVLSILLGVGQLLLPAIAWSLAIVLSRRDRFVCAVVMMIAGLSAGATWFLSVSEIVLAVPLTTVVAVLLWRPQAWHWRDAALAAAASTVLVASYETAVLTGFVLACWAGWRATRSRTRPERYGCGIVAALSLLSVIVALLGTRAGSNPTHSQSLLYFVVSFEPWPFYVALAGIGAVTAALGPWLDGAARRVPLTLGCTALVVSALGLEPDAVTAFQARGGAAVAGFLLEVFLFQRWIHSRGAVQHRADERPYDRRQTPLIFVAIPVAFVACMVALNAQPLSRWTHSLDAFRTEVNKTQDVVVATDVLPRDKRAVLWGWTSSSLSLIVRQRPDAGVLIDGTPSFVPFPPEVAPRQIADKYTWQS